MSGAGWNVALLGATGAVGRTMLRCLETSRIEVREVRLLATARSASRRLPFRGREVVVEAVAPDAFAGSDLALFSAGGAASGVWAPVAREAGAWVVDNSSRFRMDPGVALVVPEVNGHRIPAARSLIANPNCSTIQLVAALKPILDRFGLRRVTVATYQAASGTGHKGVRVLEREAREPAGGEEGRPEAAAGPGAGPGHPEGAPAPAPRAEPAQSETDAVFPHRLLGNVLPHCGAFLEDGYTQEEEKVARETQKILERPELEIHPTCVRVPVRTSHSEAVYLETASDATVAQLRETLSRAPGLRLLDRPEENAYPTPLGAEGTDPVWIGRLRRDRQVPRGFYLWIVSDNLRKGAALNAVQIAERLWDREARSA